MSEVKHNLIPLTEVKNVANTIARIIILVCAKLYEFKNRYDQQTVQQCQRSYLIAVHENMVKKSHVYIHGIKIIASRMTNKICFFSLDSTRCRPS